MTLGLFGVVVNGLLLLLVAWRRQHLVRHPVHDRRLPGQGALDRRRHRGDRRLDRDGPHHHGHRARRPRLSGRARDPRRAPRRGQALRHPGLRHVGRRPRRRRGGAPRRVPRPVAARLLGQGQRRPGDHRAARRARASGANVVSSRRVGRGTARPASRNDRITLEGIGKTAADLRAAVRAASGRRPAPLGGRREPRGGRGAGGDRPARRARQRRPAAARRPAPPQPGRHARDPRRPGRRSRDLEVRHDRDRADGGRRRDRGRRSAPGARHPPPRRLAAGRGRRVARRRAPGPGAARAHRRGPRRASTRSTSAAASRSATRARSRRPPTSGARSSRCSTPCRPIGGPPAWPSSPAGSSSAGAGWLVARVLHVRERAGAERVVVLDAGMTELIRPALYGATHPVVALTSLGRPLDDAGRDPSGAVDRDQRPPASTARSARAPTPSTPTTCPRSGAATSSRSARPARTPPRWR